MDRSLMRPLILWTVLELSEAEEHLLQRDLAHAVVFNPVFLLGCLQSAKNLNGREEQLQKK